MFHLSSRAFAWTAVWVWGKTGLIVWSGAPIQAMPPKPMLTQKTPVKRVQQVNNTKSPALKAPKLAKVMLGSSKPKPEKAVAAGDINDRDARNLEREQSTALAKKRKHKHKHKLHEHEPAIPKPSQQDVRRDQRKARRSLREKGPFRLSSPLPGASVGSGYGWRIGPISGKMGFHRGWDYGASFGRPIKAAAGGIVWRSGWMGSCGLGVILIHRKGVTTCYCHLSQILAPHRKRVQRGEIIGKVGSTGSSTSPHLHFSVLHRGRFVDPARFFKK